MRYFPMFFDLREQPVLVVGGGRVAARKVRLLLKAGARIEVVARHLGAEMDAWREQGRVRHLAREYHPDQLAAARAVFAATDDEALNRRVYDDAESRRVPVNVVDDRRHCRFITPAIVDRSPVQVAISTAGTAPALARNLRAWIERLLPMGLGRVATAAGRLRYMVKRRVPEAERRAFWDGVFEERRVADLGMQSREQIEAEIKRRLKHIRGSARTGKVYLVGAGPGRPELLTLRALQVLGHADVVLHDRLVPEGVLDLCRRDADRIDVGKRAGGRKSAQADIHRLMVREARRGRSVVRLKGGDPFVFGRGGEELEYLRAHGIGFEVVPGITAASGCAAYAGIPLTHRDHAQVLSFVTGHAAGGAESVDWSGIAGPGRTLAVYMGMSQAASIKTGLLESGVDAATPAALVCGGTRDRQKVITGSVADLPAMAARAGKGDPGLFLIGQVAALGSSLAWFNQQLTMSDAA